MDAQVSALGLFSGQGGHVHWKLAKHPLVWSEAVVVELHVLDAGLSDEGLHLIHSNDLSFFHGSVEKLLEESTLSFSAAKLEGRFHPSVSEHDAVDT